MKDEPWRDQAACRTEDPALWFPERGQDDRAAKAICATCPVRVECLEAHLTEPFGIWGGYGGRDRHRLRRGLTLVGVCPCGTVFEMRRQRGRAVYCSAECAQREHAAQKQRNARRRSA